MQTARPDIHFPLIPPTAQGPHTGSLNPHSDYSTERRQRIHTGVSALLDPNRVPGHSIIRGQSAYSNREAWRPEDGTGCQLVPA